MKTRLKLSKTVRALLQGVRERLDVQGSDPDSMTELFQDAATRMIPAHARSLAHEIKRGKRSHQRQVALKGAA